MMTYEGVRNTQSLAKKITNRS